MDNPTLGTILCQLRKRSGMTQRELARKLCVHITTIKNWEGDSCYPDAKNICALADLFHVTADYLLGRDQIETISMEGLTEPERKQLLYIMQAYIDHRLSTSISQNQQSR